MTHESTTASAVAATNTQSPHRNPAITYPAPVTAPVTARAIITDALNWIGLGEFTPGLPIPAAPVPDALAGLWVAVRRLHYTLFNSYPTLSLSAPVQDPATGVLTGSLSGSDSDQDVLTYHVGNASHGNVVIAADGSYTYTPDETFTGSDSFTVSVEDVTANPFHLFGGAGVVHSFLQHYAPFAMSNPDTAVVSVNMPATTAISASIQSDTAQTAPLAHYAFDYPAPVTAPLTVRSLLADPLNWLGAGTLASSVAIPAAPVSGLLTTAWDAVRRLHHTFFNSYPTLSLGAQTQDAATGAVTGSLLGSDSDQNALTYHVGSASHGTVVLAPDGTYTYTPDENFAHLGGTDSFVASVEDTSANPFHYFGGWDVIHAIGEHFLPGGTGNPDTKIVTVTVAPGTNNTAPTVSAPVLATPSGTDGAVAGQLSVSDPDGDKSAITTQAGPDKGTIAIDSGTGEFTYTPTAEARHDAAAESATTAQRTDTFTLAVTDTYGAITLQAITVDIAPSNTAPVISATDVAAPSRATGVVTGGLTVTDAEQDTVSFSTFAAPAHGTVAVDAITGNFTYTPTVDSRHNASADSATPAQQTDTFTIAANDSHGGTTLQTITIAVSPANDPPTGIPVVHGRDVFSGVATGAVIGSDINGDTLTYTLSSPASLGIVSLNSATGEFTYTPGVGDVAGGAAGGIGAAVPAGQLPNGSLGTVTGNTPNQWQTYSFTYTPSTTGANFVGFAFRQDPAYWTFDNVRLFAPASVTNLFTNADFAQGGAVNIVTNNGPSTIQAPAGWGVWYQDGTYPSAAGTWTGGEWYDGAVGTFDGIYQGVGLTAGITYTVTFDVSGNDTANLSTVQLGVFGGTCQNSAGPADSCSVPASSGFATLATPAQTVSAGAPPPAPAPAPPPLPYWPPDTFVVTITDGHGGSANVSVNIPASP